MARRIHLWLDFTTTHDNGPVVADSLGYDLYVDGSHITSVVGSYDPYLKGNSWEKAISILLEEADNWTPAQETFPL